MFDQLSDTLRNLFTRLLIKHNVAFNGNNRIPVFFFFKCTHAKHLEGRFLIFRSYIQFPDVVKPQTKRGKYAAGMS